MKVRWSRTAFNELEDTLSYIAERNPSAARSVARRILDRASMLGQFPLTGHATDTPAVRILAVVNYPFVIFYTVDNMADEIVILNVRHTAQGPSPEKDD